MPAFNKRQYVAQQPPTFPPNVLLHQNGSPVLILPNNYPAGYINRPEHAIAVLCLTVHCVVQSQFLVVISLLCLFLFLLLNHSLSLNNLLHSSGSSGMLLWFMVQIVRVASTKEVGQVTHDQSTHEAKYRDIDELQVVTVISVCALSRWRSTHNFRMIYIGWVLPILLVLLLLLAWVGPDGWIPF